MAAKNDSRTKSFSNVQRTLKIEHEWREEVSNAAVTVIVAYPTPGLNRATRDGGSERSVTLAHDLLKPRCAGDDETAGVSNKDTRGSYEGWSRGHNSGSLQQESHVIGRPPPPSFTLPFPASHFVFFVYSVLRTGHR